MTPQNIINTIKTELGFVNEYMQKGAPNMHEQIAPHMEKITQAIKNLDTLSDNDLKPYKDDLVSVMASVNMAIDHMMQTKEKVRDEAIALVGRIKAKQGYNK